MSALSVGSHSKALHCILLRLLYCCKPVSAICDNILSISDDPDVTNIINCRRERKVMFFRRFGELPTGFGAG